MDKVVLLRRSVKKTFGIAAILAGGFVLLNVARPDLAAKFTGTEVQKADEGRNPLFGNLFSSKKKAERNSSAYDFDRSNRSLGHGGRAASLLRGSGNKDRTIAPGRQSEGPRTRQASTGKLRKKYGTLAFGSVISADQYIPFQFQKSSAANSARPTKKHNATPRPTRRTQPRARGDGTATKHAARQPQVETASTRNRRNQSASPRAGHSENNASTQSLKSLSDLGGRIMSPLTAATIQDDALVANVLLTRAKKDIRLAPAAIAAVDGFVRLHAGTLPARQLLKELKTFRKQYGEEIKQRSTLGPNSKLQAINIKRTSLARMRSCLAHDRQISTLAIVRKTSVSGLPALFVGVKVSLLANNAVLQTIAKCLEPFYRVATVTILSSRFGGEGKAAKRVLAVKHAVIHWTGFASLSAESKAR